ncbi:MAG: hypothetical protein ACKOAC_08375, partial [Fluviibacter sp.]
MVDPEFIKERKHFTIFSVRGLFAPYSLIETNNVHIDYFMKCSTMPNPAYKDKMHFSLPGFYIGFHGTTSENRALHVKLADSNLSLDELKQIWSESPA